MQLTIERSDLLAAIDRVRGVVEARGTIPILSTLLLSAEIGGGLTVVGTDLDVEASALASADVEAGGMIAAPASTLYDIARKIPEGANIRISYSKDDPRLIVKAGRSRFQVPVLPAGDFPTMSSDGLGAAWEMKASALATMIDKAGFAMSTEETRYYLNGLYMHLAVTDAAQVLRMVATDGHRLALAVSDAPEGIVIPPNGIIIPRKTVKEIRKLCDAGGLIEIRTSSQKIQVTNGDDVITSKLIDGQFPDYSRVIPKGNDRIVSIDAKLLHAAVDRVATISSDKSRSTKLNLDGGLLTLTVRSSEAGQGVEELDVDHDGGAFEIDFNARYVLDMLSKIDGDQVEFHFGDPASPALALDPGAPGNQFVLMPLRV
jgi:DNA polymerase-3 subunit beta